MNRAQFSPAIEQAIAQAFELHKQGKCEQDCGFCFDLALSGLPSAVPEMKRIHQSEDPAQAEAGDQAPHPCPLPAEASRERDKESTGRPSAALTPKISKPAKGRFD